LENIIIHTANALERHESIKIQYVAPMHLVNLAKEYHAVISKKDKLKHFGIFIGRSNAERLYLASYLDHHYSDKTKMSYHFNVADDFHTSNIGLDSLIKFHRKDDLQIEVNFISRCPIKLTDKNSIIVDKNLSTMPGQQLLENDRQYFMQTYENFFVEVVCESYFTGNTFFPTEKIFRPIILKTPFIVQGSQFFLRGLKDLGFKTFDNWWDEGYTEDPSDWQLKEIVKVIDFISNKSQQEMQDMLVQMHDILEHNYKIFFSLSEKDFERARK
jgi:hypothetical protein